jgi:NADH-quinone oxidoreductase subunit C
MTTADIHKKLQEALGDAVGPLSEPKIDPFAVVKGERIVDACRYLKDTSGLDFDFCENITGVDYPKRNVIEVVYHLFSYKHRHQIILKVEADRAGPKVPTVESVWKAAHWMEREIFDLLGVVFEGHSDLRRVLLPDDWVGHPLRKDYAEAGGYHGVPNVRENPLVELKRIDDARRKDANIPPPTNPVAAEPAKIETPVMAKPAEAPPKAEA